MFSVYVRSSHPRTQKSQEACFFERELVSKEEKRSSQGARGFVILPVIIHPQEELRSVELGCECLKFVGGYIACRAEEVVLGAERFLKTKVLAEGGDVPEEQFMEEEEREESKSRMKMRMTSKMRKT